MIKPLVREAVESGIGEEQGGVGLAEVEFDAPGMGDLGMQYFVRGTIGDGCQAKAHVRLTMAVDQVNAIAT